jgi:hypothetical protein
MLMAIVMLLFGIAALSKGEFKITNKRKVSGSVGRTLGVILLVGAAGTFTPDYGAIIQGLTLVIVIIIGLVKSEKIDAEPKGG